MTAKQQARAKGQEAGERCLSKMDAEWSDAFFTLLRLYARKMEKAGQVWTGEDFRLWAHSKGLPFPHDARCTGPLIAKAARDGMIQRRGYAPTLSSNGSVRATYCRGAANV